MAIKLSVAVRNARLQAIEATIGTGAVLKIFSGTIPADCAAADAGGTNPLATLTLPSDWMLDAANGAKAMTGTWSDASADNAGSASHFRLYASNGTTCGLQGSVAASGADLNVDNIVFAAGQSFSITSFTITDGNP